MVRRIVLVAALAVSPAARAANPTCGPHQHMVEERDEEEGSKVKRCVCDEGFVPDGPDRCKSGKVEAPAKDKKGKK